MLYQRRGGGTVRGETAREIGHAQVQRLLADGTQLVEVLPVGPKNSIRLRIPPYESEGVGMAACSARDAASAEVRVRAAVPQRELED
jgi:hypothetical protein